MINRKVQSKKRYIYSLVIGTFLFVMIFALSYSFSYIESVRILNLQEESSYKIFEDKLDYSFFEEGVCSKNIYEKISEDLAFQGKLIDDLENNLGKDNSMVLSRKKFYSLVELEHFEFVKMLNDKCSLDVSTILFFYSNENKNLEKSETIGRLLSSVYSRNGNMAIYSFDINLETDLIKKLKNKYNIENISVIIDEKHLIVEPRNIDEIEQYLN